VRKRLSSLLILIIVLTVLALPVLAKGDKEPDGLWQYKPHLVNSRLAGGNTFLTTWEEGIWTGTFEGASREDGEVVIHRSGAWSFKATVTFESVTVEGKTGSLVMSVVGKRPDGTSDWAGKWTISCGTGDLAALRGHGTWWGPGAPAPEQWGDIWYEMGNLHFDYD